MVLINIDVRSLWSWRFITRGAKTKIVTLTLPQLYYTHHPQRPLHSTKKCTGCDDCPSCAHRDAVNLCAPSRLSQQHRTGTRTCGIPYTLATTTTPPCASAMTLVQVRTSTSGSFGGKTTPARPGN